MFGSKMTETIVALSTPQGVGAIHMIRLSGKEAIEITSKIFKGANLSKSKSHTLHYGLILNEQGNTLDDVVVGLFKGPNSYTAEDVTEISCHGSPFIAQKIIELCLRQGARIADRGEFTLRAFLNGRMDLTQAEAVADLIASSSDGAHELAIKQMRGGFSKEISRLRQELIDFAALVELELDFGEEDVEFADRSKLNNLIVEIQRVIKALLDSFSLGNVIKNGVSTVIAGRPNAGKSTLLNALLNEERAIVSDIAGTTRDTIEEILNIEGVEFRLIDTAGIREASDKIEAIGVEKTMQKIEESSLIVYVYDANELSIDNAAEDIEKLVSPTSNLLVIGNKVDLTSKTDVPWEHKTIFVSAKEKQGITNIKETLFKMVIENERAGDSPIVSNSRHYDALYKAHESLSEVLTGLSLQIPGDLVAIDIRKSLHHLGEITGEINTDDLLDSIFTRFCIGK